MQFSILCQQNLIDHPVEEIEKVRLTDSDLHLDAQLCRPALARDAVAKALEATLRVGLVQCVVTCI